MIYTEVTQKSIRTILMDRDDIEKAIINYIGENPKMMISNPAGEGTGLVESKDVVCLPENVQIRFTGDNSTLQAVLRAEY